MRSPSKAYSKIGMGFFVLGGLGVSIGRCALLPNGFGEGNVSQHVAIIRLAESAIRRVIHLSLISPIYQKLIMKVQVGDRGKD
jgi:type I restriction enzyme S subunit